MLRRAQQVDETRQRITEAAVRLHTSRGPSEASIAAIAEEAGVTRLTVYRHFPDQEELFAACMNHWESLHPPPNPLAWSAIKDLVERARVALRDLYTWYSEVGGDLAPIHRDLEHLPPGARARIEAGNAWLAEAIVGDEGRDETVGTRRARRLRAIAAHLVRLETWRSLVVEQGLDTAEAVDIGVAWLRAAANQDAGNPASV
jgi:AcrR family transcriptional regulator